MGKVNDLPISEVSCAATIDRADTIKNISIFLIQHRKKE